MLRMNPARAPEPVSLRAPLRQLWSVPGANSGSGTPLLDAARRRVIARYRTGRVRLAALELDTGKAAWQALADSGNSAVPLAIVGNIVVASSWPAAIVFLDAATGAEIRRIEGISARVAALVDDVVIGQGYDGVWAVRISTGELLWQEKLQPRLAGEWAFCASSDRMVLGLDDGAIVALSLADGRELWRTPLSAHTTLPKQYAALLGTPNPRGVASLHGDTAIFRVGVRFVSAVSLTSGKPLWSRDAGGYDGWLSGDRYHVLGLTSHYVVLDARSGRKLLAVPLEIPKALLKEHVSLGGSFGISETNVFVATENCALLAYERETGAHVWSTLTGGNHGQLGGLVLTQDCLLTSGGADLRCFVEASSVGRRLEPPKFGWKPKAGYLPFEITAVVPDGASQVLCCRTLGASPAQFCFAFKADARSKLPIDGGDVRLWVETVAAGERLLGAFRKTFPPGRSARFGKAQRVGAAREFEALVLPDGGDGPGWVRSKWSDADEAAEFFVHWSVAEKVGYFEEREDLCREAICDHIASLLVRADVRRRR